MPNFDQKAWATATVTIVTVISLTWLTHQAFLGGRAVDMAVGENKISISGEENFRDVFRAAVATDRGEVSDALRERGFFHVASPDLVRTIRDYKMPPELQTLMSEAEVDAATRAFDLYARAFLVEPIKDLDEIEDVAARAAAEAENQANMTAARHAAKSMRDHLLTMVGSLSGPFQTPGTLHRTNEQFKEALRDLHAAMDETRSAGPLLTWLWLSSIDGQELFEPKDFRAVVRPAAERRNEREAVVVGCPGNPFRGREVELVAPAGLGAMLGTIEDLPGRMICDDPGPDLSHMLAGQPVRLAINAEAARRLFGPEGFESPIAQEILRMQPGPDTPDAYWTFRVMPTDYRPKEVEPELAMSNVE